MRTMKQEQIIKYYHSLESRLGYGLFLKGIKHFGYYPTKKNDISIYQAQILLIEKLAKKLNLRRNARVLDAGCGEGFTAIYLAKNCGYHVTGIDLLDFNIAHARESAEIEHLRDKPTFIEGDYTKLPFGDNSFDALYTLETLVHAPDYKKALKEFRRVLKPKGKLVLFEYTMLRQDKLTLKQRQIAAMINNTSGMYSLPYFTHSQFPKILKHSGFNVLSSETITPYVLPTLRRFYQLARIPYFFISLLKLQKTFINATTAVESYRNLRDNIFEYVVTEAEKS